MYKEQSIINLSTGNAIMEFSMITPESIACDIRFGNYVWTADGVDAKAEKGILKGFSFTYTPNLPTEIDDISGRRYFGFNVNAAIECSRVNDSVSEKFTFIDRASVDKNAAMHPAEIVEAPLSMRIAKHGLTTFRSGRLIDIVGSSKVSGFAGSKDVLPWEIMFTSTADVNEALPHIPYNAKDPRRRGYDIAARTFVQIPEEDKGKISEAFTEAVKRAIEGYKNIKWPETWRERVQMARYEGIRAKAWGMDAA